MDHWVVIALALSFCSTLTYGCGEGLESSRIIGGGQANKNSIPWQVRLAADGGAECGGTILCPRFVMTAAQCVEKAGTKSYLTPSAVTINAEEHSQSDGNDHTTHTVKKIHRHAKYQGSWTQNIDWNFAILELDKPIDLSKSSKARAACLPEASDARIFKRGTTFVASGWGRHVGGNNIDSPDKLRHVTLPWQPKMECGAGGIDPDEPLICAGVRGKKGACQGDDGGPLTWVDNQTSKVKLMGVSSFVLGNWTWRGDLRVGHCNDLSGFADVTKVLDWIQGIIKGCNGSSGPDGNGNGNGGGN